MFRQLFDYIWHWLLSHSRHGTHSPFVYRLVDEVVYKTHAAVPQRVEDIRPAKVNALVNRVVDFWVTDHNAEKREWLLIGPDEDFRKVFDNLLPGLHPGTLLIFRGIYQSEKNKAAWRDIIAHEKVTVGIDLYYIGLVFFRKGQVKENFRIRF